MTLAHSVFPKVSSERPPSDTSGCFSRTLHWQSHSVCSYIWCTIQWSLKENDKHGPGLTPRLTCCQTENCCSQRLSNDHGICAEVVVSTLHKFEITDEIPKHTEQMVKPGLPPQLESSFVGNIIFFEGKRKLMERTNHGFNPDKQTYDA